MAPLTATVQDFSSEDSVNKAENILNTSKSKWLCNKCDVGTELVLTLRLDAPSRINDINIGNHGCASIEIKVGKSTWQEGRAYELLLPCVTMMSPADCKDWVNTSKVFMFSQTSFRGHTAQQKWDCVRISCMQPFEKQKQFGLGFFELRGIREKGKVQAKNKQGVNSVEEGTKHVKNIISKAINSSGGLNSHTMNMSRTQRCLRNALFRAKKNKQRSFTTSHFEKTPDSEEDNFQLDSGLAFCENTKPFSSSSGPIHTKQLFSKLTEKKVFWSNDMLTSKRMVSKMFIKEVESFLKEINISKLNLKADKVSDLRHRFENLCGVILSRKQKKIFFEIVGRKVNDVMFQRDSDESGFDSSGNQTSSEGLFIPSKMSKDERRKMSEIRMKRRNTTVTQDVLFYGAMSSEPPKKSSNEKDIVDMEGSRKKDDDRDIDDREVYSECQICGKSMSEVTLRIHRSFCQGKSEFDDENQDLQSDVIIMHAKKGRQSSENEMVETEPAVNIESNCISDISIPKKARMDFKVSSFMGSDFICSLGTEHFQKLAAAEYNVSCPICFGTFPQESINSHVNYCLDSDGTNSFQQLD